MAEPDVLVEAEQVARVVGVLARYQAGVLLVAPGVADPVGLVREVEVRGAGAEWPQGRGPSSPRCFRRALHDSCRLSGSVEALGETLIHRHERPLAAWSTAQIS